jgi:hypothetical protein
LVVFLSVSNVRENTCNPVWELFLTGIPEGFYRQELFLPGQTYAVRSIFPSADRQEKLLFPVELFLSAGSCRLAVRNIIPVGLLAFPDGLQPSGKICGPVVMRVHKS